MELKYRPSTFPDTAIHPGVEDNTYDMDRAKLNYLPSCLGKP